MGCEHHVASHPNHRQLHTAADECTNCYSFADYHPHSPLPPLTRVCMNNMNFVTQQTYQSVVHVCFPEGVEWADLPLRPTIAYPTMNLWMLIHPSRTWGSREFYHVVDYQRIEIVEMTNFRSFRQHRTCRMIRHRGRLLELEAWWDYRFIEGKCSQ